MVHFDLPSAESISNCDAVEPQYSKSTKLKLYQSCVLSTLLYGSECWRMTEVDLEKLSAFHTKCLRRISQMFWPKTKSNQDLLAECNQHDMAIILLKRR